MNPADAADVLRRTLKDPSIAKTVADASVESGLAFRDAESGLHWLTSVYRGHLRVTEDGDLIHVFPNGFTKPWETREALQRAFATVSKALFATGRFVVRAWLLVAMIGYALVFVALIVALTLARSSSDRDDGVGAGGALFGGLLRAIGDAVFWTFHPFSPLAIGYGGDVREHRPSGDQRRTVGRSDAKVPFYEKVNRFVFGPAVPAPDPRAMRARILEEIRVQKGRIGLADVMRVTGLPREEADPLMARLMLDHDGSVEVAEQGGILYRFQALRRTAAEVDSASTSGRAKHGLAVWDTPVVVPPLTGNDGGANVTIALLNGFNLLAGAWVLANGLTLSNVLLLLTTRMPRGAPPMVLPNDGLPVALGLVPLLFSVALFALPLARVVLARRADAAARIENARLAILREVLARAPKKEPVPDEVLRIAYRVATGKSPTSAEITRRVVDLGGDVSVGPEGEVRYRFADLEAEAEALADERAQAVEGEAKVGRIVFASDS